VEWGRGWECNLDQQFQLAVSNSLCRYNKATEGEYSLKPQGETAAQRSDPERRLSNLTNVCFSVHKVYACDLEIEQRRKCMSYCKLNPLFLSCSCKGFHHHSICSHVIAVGQMMQLVDAKRLLRRIKNRTAHHRHAAAHNRMQPSSSDEED
jgi:hypothetical protein